MTPTVPMGPFAFLASLLVLCGVACKSNTSKDTELRRTRDQAAVVVVGGAEAQGKLASEVEPNNELSEAQVIAIGEGATGSLEGSLDVDRYAVSAEEQGMLFVKLSGAADADLKLELQDAEGKSLARSDRGPAATSEGIAGFWIEAGKAHQLVVSEFTKKKNRKSGGRQGASAPYRLEVSLRVDPEAGFEIESNEDVEGAMEILAGEERHGYIGWAGDSDWWRVPVTGFADVAVGAEELPRPALHIVVSGIPDVATSLELLDAAGQLVASRLSASGQEVALRSFVPEVSAEFYVVKVQAKRSNPEEGYTVRVENVQLLPGNEEEPNDELARATPLASQMGELVLGNGELCLGDVDMFTLSPEAMNRVMDLRLDGPGDADLDVSVVAESGAVLALSEQSGVGVSETLQAVNVLPNSTPIIIVRAKKIGVPAAYKLSLSLAEGQGVPQAPALPSPENPDLEE